RTRRSSTRATTARPCTSRSGTSCASRSRSSGPSRGATKVRRRTRDRPTPTRRRSVIRRGRRMRAPTDDLDALLDVLPAFLGEAVRAQDRRADLLEVVMDLGRRPEARYPGAEADLAERDVAQDDIDHVVARIGEFTADNRAGIARTLHRISCIRNRKGRI